MHYRVPRLIPALLVLFVLLTIGGTPTQVVAATPSTGTEPAPRAQPSWLPNGV